MLHLKTPINRSDYWHCNTVPGAVSNKISNKIMWQIVNNEISTKNYSQNVQLTQNIVPTSKLPVCVNYFSLQLQQSCIFKVIKSHFQCNS